MTTIEIPVPDHLEFNLGLRTRQELSDEARILLAVKLFELERLSSGRAAELAGMDRETFLMTLPRYGVSAVKWCDEELQAEANAVLK